MICICPQNIKPRHKFYFVKNKNVERLLNNIVDFAFDRFHLEI
jgi:hypothetical protein